jgi:hypothetical protein
MFPSFSNSYLTERPVHTRVTSNRLNLSGVSVISNSPYKTNKLISDLGSPTRHYTNQTSKFNSADPFQQDYIKSNLNNIERKLHNMTDNLDARSQLVNALISGSDKNIGIYNPYIGNPIIGTKPQNSRTNSLKNESTKSFEPSFKNTNTRLESIEYQQFLQEQLIQKRKEKLQENNFKINSLILQNIDDMSDNLELFKAEMYNHVKKIEKRALRQNFDEIVDELDYLKGYFKESFDRAEKTKLRDFEEMRENMNYLKEDLQDVFKIETEKHRNYIKGVTNEMRGYQEEINKNIEDADLNNRFRAQRMRRQFNKLREETQQGFDDIVEHGFGYKNYKKEEIDNYIKDKGMDKRTDSMKKDEELKDFLEKYKSTNNIVTKKVNKEDKDPDGLMNIKDKDKDKDKFKAQKDNKLIGNYTGTGLNNFE